MKNDELEKQASIERDREDPVSRTLKKLIKDNGLDKK